MSSITVEELSEFNDGFEEGKIEMKELAEGIHVPATVLDNKVFVGYDFETIDKDLFDNLRENEVVGRGSHQPSD